MSTYAIIKTGGKQVKVEVGQAVYVEKLNVEAGQEVTFKRSCFLLVVKTLLSELHLFQELLLLGTVEKQGKQKESCYLQVQT